MMKMGLWVWAMVMAWAVAMLTLLKERKKSALLDLEVMDLKDKFANPQWAPRWVTEMEEQLARLQSQVSKLRFDNVDLTMRVNDLERMNKNNEED